MAFIYKIDNDKIITQDVIHGQIVIPYPFSKIVLCKEMKRLENISQNGFSQYEYESLENSDRLSHSVGAFHVMNLIIEKLESLLKQYDIEICKDEKDIALCSMLLHDIGHGPFSHSLEEVTNYSHEKRTTDILLGDTEVNKILTELYGTVKVKQIANFIAKINDQEEIEKDSFTKLFKTLISHQLDADRIDYLMRDAYYVGIKSSINLDTIISNLEIIINNNKEYELLFNRKGLSSIENILIQRYQMYRDVYLSPISVLGDYLFKVLLERYKNNIELKDLPVSESFKILAHDSKIENLDDFINMSDNDFKESFKVLINNQYDKVISYLSDKNNIHDYIIIENDTSVDKIKNYLKEIFKEYDLSNTLSVIHRETKNKLYKKEQTLNVKFKNRILDLTECTNLIRPQEILDVKYTYFNPNLLRIELGLSEKEFEKYESEVNKMIEHFNKNPEEFELKYIVDNKESNILDKIIQLLKENGFSVISTSHKENCDEYYDFKNLELYNIGGSLRIRKVNENGKTKVKGTFKYPLNLGEVYSSRTEIEELLPDDSIETFKSKMTEVNVPLDLERIVPFPILNSNTDRIDVVLEKNGVKVCLSLDNSCYTNPFLNNISLSDTMIEIEAIKMTAR